MRDSKRGGDSGKGQESGFLVSDVLTISDERLSFARRRPAVVALGAAALGIFFAQSSLVSHWWWGAGAVVCGVLALFGGVQSRVWLGRHVTGFIILGLCLIFALRAGYQRQGVGARHIQRLVDIDQSVTVYGTVSDWPDVREHKTLLTVRVDSATIVGTGASRISERTGSVLLHIATQTYQFQRHDRIIVSGELRSPAGRVNPGGFDFARHLHWKDIFGVMYLPHPFGIVRDAPGRFSVSAVVSALRGYILKMFFLSLEPEQAGLASGFLIGETSTISSRVYNHFRNSGTLHLLAVSGSNVAIILLTLRLLLWPFPFSRKTLYSILFLGGVLFCLVSQNEPSVVRATVMVSVFLLGRILERRIDYHNGIASAGLMILLWSPNQLFDVGFQLSFIVAWMIILFVENVNRVAGKHSRRVWYRFFAVPLLVALVAQLSAAPLSLYYFGVAPAWSTIANILVGPIVSLAVGVSLALLTVSLLSPMLSIMIGSALNYLLGLVLSLLEVFGGSEAPIIRVASLQPWESAAALALLALAGVAIVSVRARRAIVFALVLLPLVVIGGRGLLQAQNENSLWLYVTRGGTVALYTGEEPILTVMDCDQRPEALYNYTVAGRVRAHVDPSTLSVFALSADYQTFALALMVSDSLNISGLYLSDRLRGLSEDQLAQREILGSFADGGEYRESIKPEYSGALDRFVLEDWLVDDSSGVTVLAGSTVSLLRAEGLYVMFLSDAFSSAELLIGLSAFGSSALDGRKAFLIADQPTARLAQALNTARVSCELELIFQSTGNELPALNQFRSGNILGVVRTMFLSETGAVELSVN